MHCKEMNAEAEMLAVCLKNHPVTLTIYSDVGTYNVRDGQERYIWADDLPLGGYPVLLEALSQLICERDREGFAHFLASEACMTPSSVVAELNEPFSKRLKVSRRMLERQIIIDIEVIT